MIVSISAAIVASGIAGELEKAKKIEMNAYMFYDWDIETREWFLHTLQYVNRPGKFLFDGHTIFEDSRFYYLKYLT